MEDNGLKTMKNECKNYIEAAFADDGNQNAAFKAHCADCSECASRASDWNRLRNAAMPAREVPIALDFAILTAARLAAQKRARRRVTIRRIIYYSAAAASVTLACLVTIFPPDNNRRSNLEVVKSWDWSKFNKEVFETDAAIEISKNYISIAGKPEEPAPKILLLDEEQEQI